MIGAVLGWKFDHAPGIRTKQQPDGSITITGWPASLGALPTPEQLAQWTAEYEAARKAEPTLADVVAAIREHDAALAAKIDAETGKRP
jgi:hypothetical protein